MFSLETAMLTVFGTLEENLLRRIMITLTGSIFGLMILAIGFFMIIRGSKEIGKIKREL